MAFTMTMNIDELIEEFDFFSDWDDRCDFLIDLGLELPKLPEEMKTEPHRVHGCQSNVWMTAHITGTPAEPRIEFLANSDAMIVNGLIAVLMAIYNGKSPAEVLATNPETIFRRLELDRHLSSQRKNGLFGMVTRIRELAARAEVDLARSREESA